MKSSSKPKRLQWLWPALEAIPGTAAVRTDWRERLGTEFESNLFLQQQTWPRSQTRLLLIDTSQSDTFSRMIRHWRAECDYSQVQSVALTVGAAGLADEDRRDLEVRRRTAGATLDGRTRTLSDRKMKSQTLRGLVSRSTFYTPRCVFLPPEF